MASGTDQPIGQDIEAIIDLYYDNTSQRLKRHVHVRDHQDEDIPDCIFKKGDYTNTYIVIKIIGEPINATLKLVDENSNQLYSPVDTDGNWITTACTITTGEENIIQLPAQFSNQFSTHIPFPAGTYNWKLIYDGDVFFEPGEIPLTVEIRDFKVWDILTPQIFPNEDVRVRLKTYADTYFPANSIDSNILTSNAIYNESNGIITYPNSDINDLTIGKHMQVINQANNCFIDYEVKNPISCEASSFIEYNNTFMVRVKIQPGCTLRLPYAQEAGTIFIIDNQYRYAPSTHSSDEQGATTLMKNWSTHSFLPGTHALDVACALEDIVYTCHTSFNVGVDNCSLLLTANTNYIDKSQYEQFTLIAQYQHNNTPLVNATIGFYKEGILQYTGVTDENGQCYYTNNQAGAYQAKVLDNNMSILDSNTYTVYDIQYYASVEINNMGNLIASTYIGEYNQEELINNIALNENANLDITTDINENQEDIVVDIDIDNEGNLTYTKFGDI